jgi:predicted alpha/beta-fold hydrolase
LKQEIPTYHAPHYLPGGHLQTIVPALTRKVSMPVHYERERIETSDKDFLDLDWLKNGNKKLLILCHGLEGSSDRPYIMGMARQFFNDLYDVLAWNYRGCSEEINLAPRMYHSGATEDLHFVFNHAAAAYDEVHLIGFSLGGNLVLKYLGEQGSDCKIKRAVAFSVPLDLHDGVTSLDRGINKAYAYRFLRSLRRKILVKHEQFPDLIDVSSLQDIKTIYDFDDTYTSHLHGFHNATDYYYKCSSIHFIESISIPTLIVNAANDPMIGKIAISPRPFPNHDHVTFHLSNKGGHCGFSGYSSKTLWSEKVALSFINEG